MRTTSFLEVEKRRESKDSRRIILSDMMDRQECLSYFGWMRMMKVQIATF
jgi:hypothetical protein